jgi:hypothetical protein
MKCRALGIDLASASWDANGSALIEYDDDTMAFERVVPGVLEWPRSQGERPTAAALADTVDRFVRREEVSAVALDGPQGWRDPARPATERGVGRRCELACRTQGKTGVHPKTYPATQREWIMFSVAVFDALLARRDVVLGESVPLPSHASYVVVECFPTSTWRASALPPLPGKQRVKQLALGDYARRLSDAFGLPAFETTSHDDLQAVVAALVAVAVQGGPALPVPHGMAASSTAGSDGAPVRVEGIIWDAKPRGEAPVRRPAR